jgi:transcription-repair coupling factor (superfamily II helicase)
MSNFFGILREIDGFISLARALRDGNTPALATGVLDSQKCHICAGLTQTFQRTSVIVTYSELKAREIYEDMELFLPGSVKFYPSKDIIFYSADIKSADITRQRFSVVKSLLNGEQVCVVLSAEALLDRLAPPRVFKDNILTLKPGDVIEIEDLARRLVYMGYERVDLVEAPGHFAVRGGILDLFTTVYENALRIDFFDDEIDSIRLLDTYSQRSIENLKSAVIYPMRELVFGADTLAAADERISAEFERTYAALKTDHPEEAENLREHIGTVLETMRSQQGSASLDEYMIYFYPEAEGLFGYLPPDSLLFFDEPNRIDQRMETVLAEYAESIRNRILKGRMLPAQAEIIFSYETLLSQAAAFDSVLLCSMQQTVKDFHVLAECAFEVKSAEIFQYSALSDDLRHWRDQGYMVLLLAGSRFQGQKLAEEIVGMGLSSRYCDNLADAELSPAVITVTRGGLKNGFEYPGVKLAVISVQSGAKEHKKKKAAKSKASKIESFTDLRVGDYVVHENHGIGVYEGIEQIEVDGVSRDYLKLSYADGGKLYVQTNQMDMIQKYIGGDNAHLKLNKLGGTDWGKTKSRARKAVADLAKGLVALYAKRQSSKGFVYSKDTVWQREFEDQFPFVETEDQMTAISDVKKDMEAGKVMDRLICGDVGYGKTEIAIRAAFKAVQDNRQVAYLAPTTILVQQHYTTFRQRMQEFPIAVEMLSRFKTGKENKDTVEHLKTGTCDIVIGTHRLLSKDVGFRNLGLIVVDEEQRFGVKAKERLKELRENVDVLTLTATPIPRTLHMSLTGIRDMSILEDPPQERQPIQTYVMEFSPEFVRDAISRELARGGQVYYLHNRVHNIVEEADRVAKLAPFASVAYAHGQMTRHELENIMMQFISGDINVLVCTTIIETGLDIPNVNTIIIQDADYMGLAQLYQLRGRVGRSNRLAYAYLMYRRDKVLPEVAEKRLQTIREFTEFGSGFKIAMRDLEIRGAGNLLGAEQHGHMDAIGYDLYCKLLYEEVARLEGKPQQEDFETLVDIPINAFIPPGYIQNEEQKLEMYKKISLIGNMQDYYDVQEELEDRYGDLPRSVQNLLSVALMKAAAHKVGVTSMVKKGQAIVITFKADAPVDAAKLAQAVSRDRLRLLFTQAPNPYLTYRLGSDEAVGKLDELRKLFENLV